MTEKTLFLHVGLPKTATTALQNFFYLNASQIKKSGVVYPDLSSFSGSLYTQSKSEKIYQKLGTIYKYISLDSKNGNGYPLAYHYLPDKNVTRCAQKNITFDRLSSLLSKLTDSVLLSSEWFGQLTIENLGKLKNIAECSGFGVKVICYIRRQDKLIESHYAQSIKIKGIDDTFDEFVYDINFKNQLMKFFKCFGENNVNVRCFEKKQLINGSIYRDFLAAMSLSPSHLAKFKVPSDSVNKSLSAGSLNLLRYLAKHDVKPSNEWIMLINLLEGFKEDNSIRPSWFSPAERYQYMQGLEKLNSEFAQRYLGRKDGRLFYEALPATNAHWVPAESVRLSAENLKLVAEKLESQFQSTIAKNIGTLITQYVIS